MFCSEYLCGTTYVGYFFTLALMARRNEMKKLIGLCLLFLIGCYSNSAYIAKHMQDIDRREKFILEHPLLPKEIKEIILAGKVISGMNKHEVIASIGEPLKIEKIYSTYYGMEEYVVVRWIYDQNYVVFRNGILIGSTYGSKRIHY